MPVFSGRIAQEFAKEVYLECPVALEILRTFSRVYFSDGAFTMNCEQALDHFKKVMTRFSVKLYGMTLRHGVDSDAFDLWRFFYISGVINARVSDSGQPDGYRHLIPEADPLFVMRSRWNELQKTLWEINTVFRDYLMSVAREEQMSTGLAVKKPKPKRR